MYIVSLILTQKYVSMLITWVLLFYYCVHIMYTAFFHLYSAFSVTYSLTYLPYIYEKWKWKVCKKIKDTSQIILTCFMNFALWKFSRTFESSSWAWKSNFNSKELNYFNFIEFWSMSIPWISIDWGTNIHLEEELYESEQHQPQEGKKLFYSHCKEIFIPLNNIYHTILHFRYHRSEDFSSYYFQSYIEHIVLEHYSIIFELETCPRRW